MNPLLTDLPYSISQTKEMIEYFQSELSSAIQEDDLDSKYITWLHDEITRHCKHLIELNSIPL